MRLPSNRAHWCRFVAAAALVLLLAPHDASAEAIDRDRFVVGAERDRLDALRSTPPVPSATFSLRRAAATASWFEGFAGPDAREPASLFVVLDDTIVRTGAFHSSAGRHTLHVAQWRNGGWFAMDDGFTEVYSGVSGLFVFEGDLYASGTLGFGQYLEMTYRHLVRWTGTDWIEVPQQSSFDVVTTAEVDGVLHVAPLEHVPEIYAKTVGRWVDGQFVPFGFATPADPGARISALVVDDAGDLIVAGAFESFGGVSSPNIVRVHIEDGEDTGVEALGDGVKGPVTSAVLFEGDVVVASAYRDDNFDGRNVLRFRDGVWQPLGEGLNARATALGVFDGRLVASGAFTASGSTPIRHLAVFDGESWSEFEGGTRGFSSRIVVDGERLVVGGGPLALDLAEGAEPLGVWANGAWQEFGRGLDGPVRRLFVFEDRLYAVGSFTQAGYALAGRIAAWDGRRWHAVAGGFEARVSAIAVHDDRLVVGGNFPAAAELGPDNEAGRIATIVDGEAVPLGRGFDDEVLALASDGKTLYAGGVFDHATGVRVGRIAGWNGTNWFALGQGISGAVHALAPYDGGLVAAGSFDRAGGMAARNVAFWDGAAWHALGAGLPDRVETLAVFDGHLVAGGLFDDGLLRGVARWNGQEWQPMGAGLDGFVFGLRADGTALHATGWFGGVGRGDTSVVATWDGHAWTHLGDAVDGWIEDVVRFRGDLYFGGRFLRIGDVHSSNIARWLDAEPHVPASRERSGPAILSVRLSTSNPTDGPVRFTLETSRTARVEIDVYDLRGRLVRHWPATAVGPGPHVVEWNGRTTDGTPVANGTYLLRVGHDGAVTTRKVVVVR